MRTRSPGRSEQPLHPPADLPEEERPSRSRATVVCAVYLLLSVGVYWRAWMHPRTVAIGSPWDPAILTWFLGWQRHAITHGLDPLFTNFMNYPAGLNAMWNTSLLLPGMVLAPVTALLGAVFSYNLLATLGTGLSAFLAFIAIRRFVPKPWIVAFLGGLFYGFSPYMLVLGAGRIHMTFALFPPLLVIALDEMLVRRQWSVLKVGTFLGVATGVQYLVSSELLVESAIAAIVSVGILAALHPSEVAARLGRSARCLLLAAGISLVIVAVPLTYQFAGSQQPGAAAIHKPNAFVSDLDGFITPTRAIQFSTRGDQKKTATFTGNTGEQASYLGLPMIVLVGIFAVRHRRSRSMWLAVGSSFVIVLLSLGSTLHIGGHKTHIWLPWSLLQGIPGPIFKNILPSRLMLFVFLPLAFVFAAFVRDWTQRPKRLAAWVGALLTILVLASFFPRLPYPTMSTAVPAFFTSPSVTEIAPGSVALVGPLGETMKSALLWQAASDFRYRMVGGWYVGPDSPRSPASTDLLNTMRSIEQRGAGPAVADRARLLEGLRDLGVQTVIVGPATTPIDRDGLVRFLSDLLGAPPEHTGGVDVWVSIK